MPRPFVIAKAGMSRLEGNRAARAARAMSVTFSITYLACALAACGSRPSSAARATLPAARNDGDGAMARLSRGQQLERSQNEDAPATQVGDEDLLDDEHEWAYDEAPEAQAVAVDETTYPSPTPPPSPTAGDYRVTDIVSSGKGSSIEGRVLWKPARGAAGVRGAVVYLENIRAGKPPRLQLDGTLALAGHRLAPRVQLTSPVGSLLTITSTDTRLARLVMTRRNIENPTPSSASTDGEFVVEPGTQVVRLLDRDGLFEVTQPDDPASPSAWIVVAPHPYYAITDENGRFRLDDVPAGEYVLAAWHPSATGSKPGRVTLRVGERGHSVLRVEIGPRSPEPQ